MLAIVSGHLLSQSSLAGVEGTNHILAMLLGSGVRIGVNVFLLLGVWFMVDAKFKAERIVRLYLEVVFYSVPMTIGLYLAGQAGGMRNVIQGLLPFFGRSVWFASAYISLIALSPFLNKVFLLPKRSQQVLLVLLVILFCIVPTIPCSTPLDYLADFTWFCVVYLLVGMWKKSDLGTRFRGKWRFLLAGGGRIWCLSRQGAFRRRKPWRTTGSSTSSRSRISFVRSSFLWASCDWTSGRTDASTRRRAPSLRSTSSIRYLPLSSSSGIRSSVLIDCWVCPRSCSRVGRLASRWRCSSVPQLSTSSVGAILSLFTCRLLRSSGSCPRSTSSTGTMNFVEAIGNSRLT